MAAPDVSQRGSRSLSGGVVDGDANQELVQAEQRCDRLLCDDGRRCGSGGVLDAIDDLTTVYGKEIPFDDLVKRSKEQGVENPEDIIRKMQSEGMLFSPRQGMIQKL